MAKTHSSEVDRYLIESLRGVEENAYFLVKKLIILIKTFV